MSESKTLSPEEYELWEKAFLAALEGYCANPGTTGNSERVYNSVARADEALIEMRARNPKFKQTEGPYR